MTDTLDYGSLMHRAMRGLILMCWNRCAITAYLEIIISLSLLIPYIPMCNWQTGLRIAILRK